MTTFTETGTASRPCPTCKAVPDTETGRCRCSEPPGDRAPATTDSAPGPLLTRAESLFESYLAARLVRARRTLTTAKVALLRDPRNRAKLEALRTAERETHRLHEQLLEQRRKVARAQTGTSAAAASGDTEPTEDFRLLQAAKAEAVYQSATASERQGRSLPDDRECPKCGERLPGEVMTCACGHRFTPGEDDVVAEPFLTDDEIAALRGKLSK